VLRLAAVTAASTAAPVRPGTAPETAARAHARSGRRTVTLAAVYYLLASLALTLWLWRDPAWRTVAGNPNDADQLAWFFRYDATAVAHFHLPALVTTAMNAPQGVILMWNTPLLLPGGLLAPVPLVVALHPSGGSPAGFLRTTRFDSVADAHGFVVAYLATLPPRSPAWRGVDRRRNLAYISSEIKTLIHEQNIDPRRVYVIGFSYPVVPQGRARLRTQSSAAHSQEDLRFAPAMVGEVQREFKL